MSTSPRLAQIRFALLESSRSCRESRLTSKTSLVARRDNSPVGVAPIGQRPLNFLTFENLPFTGFTESLE